MDWTELFPEAARLLRTHERIRQGEVVDCDGVALELSPDVLSPLLTRTTRFFARSLHVHNGATLAEIGVGAGYTLASLGQRYSGLIMFGSDINAAAVSLAHHNLQRHAVSAQLAVGHLFNPLPPTQYDYILFNPPLLIADTIGYSDPLTRALVDNNGDTINEFFDALPEYMHSGSTVYILHTNRQNVSRVNPRSEALDRLAAKAHLVCDVTATLDAGYEIYTVNRLRVLQ